MTPDILVVEPNPQRAERIRGALSPLVNWVEVFTDGSEAHDYLMGEGEYEGNRRVPGLVILDADVMGDACFETVARMRDMERFRGTKVVVVSAEPDLDSIRRARQAGASRYNGKPLTLDALAQMLGSVEDLDPAVVHSRLVQEDRRFRDKEGRP